MSLKHYPRHPRKQWFIKKKPSSLGNEISFLVPHLFTRKKGGQRRDAMAVLLALAGAKQAKTARQEMGQEEGIPLLPQGKAGVLKKKAAGDSHVLNFNTKLFKYAE